LQGQIATCPSADKITPIFAPNQLLLEEKEKPYDIDLGRFKNHKKVFPWMFVIKVIIGLTMMAFIYYMTKELFEKPSVPGQIPGEGIEVEISPD
jgi:hypothetical protein